MKVSAVVAAAGEGKRAGKARNKLYLHIKGKPVIIHTLLSLKKAEQITEIILVVATGEEELCQNILNRFHIKGITTTTGGNERQFSVANGLAKVSGDAELILVHDGARPLISSSIIAETINAACLHGAAVTAVPVTNTIKEEDGKGFVKSTLKRSHLWSVQSPQVFKPDLIKEAHRKAARDGFIGTDDAALVERLGHPVKIVEGSPENIKITTPQDLIIAREILERKVDSL